MQTLLDMAELQGSIAQDSPTVRIIVHMRCHAVLHTTAMF